MSKKNRTSLKKFVALATMLSTVLWMCGVAMLVPNVASAISEGDLVRSDGIKVYIVNAHGYKRHIYNPEVFNMYGHFTWASIQDVAASVTASYTTSDLYRAAGDTRVYSVGEDGIKHWLNMTAEEFVAEGYNWNQVFVVNSTEGNYYTVGSSIGVGGVTPPETPVVGSGLTVALASDTPAAGIAVNSAASMPFTKVNLTASSEAAVTVDSITVERTGLSNDNNITSIVLVDVATDTIIGTSKTLGALHTCVFNDDFVVPAGTTKAIYLAANMDSSLNAGETAALSLKAVATKASAAVNGTLPIIGNMQAMNGTLAIGTLTLAAGGSNPAAATKKVGEADYVFASLQFGTITNEDIILDKITFNQEGTAADADVANLELVMNGEIKATGTLSGKKVTFDLNPNITIAKGTTKEFSLRGDIISGSSRTIDFDIKETAYVKVKGATYGYNITPTYPSTTDPYFNGVITTISTGTLTVSKGVVASTNVAYGSTGAVLGAFKFNAQGEEVSITRLIFNITIAGTAAGGTAADITNLTVYDEAGALVAGPVDPVDNTGPDQATTSDTIIVPLGMHTYKVKGDLNQDWLAGQTILLSLVTPDVKITAKGVTTANTITASPSTAVSGDTMTVKAGALNVSTLSTPSAQTVIVSAQNYLFSKFLFDATASGEDVNVTQIALKHTSSAAVHTNITGITLYDTSIGSQATCEAVSGRTWNATLSECALNSPAQGTATANTATDIFSATTTIAISGGILTIPKGTSKTIYLRADITSGSANQTHQFGLVGNSVTATGKDTGATISEVVSASNGQAMTIQTAGRFTIVKDSSSPADLLLAAGTTGTSLLVMGATAEWEAVKITSIQLNSDAVNSGTVAASTAALYLYEEGNSTPLATTYATSTVVLFSIPEGTTLSIPTGSGGKKLTVKADMLTIGDESPAASGKGFNLDLDAAADVIGQGTVSSTAATARGAAITNFASFYLYKSKPTVSIESIASSSLVSGTGVELFRYKITADAAGDIGYYKASFLITTTTATVTAFELFEYDTAGTETNLCYGATKNATPFYVSSTGGAGASALVEATFDTSGTSGDTEYRVIPAGSYRTYKLRGSVTAGTTGSIATSLLGDGAAVTTTTYPADAGSTDGSTGIDAADNENEDFIWSDLWYSTTSTATRTSQWTNGYLVTGLISTSSATSIVK